MRGLSCSFAFFLPAPLFLHIALAKIGISKTMFSHNIHEGRKQHSLGPVCATVMYGDHSGKAEACLLL